METEIPARELVERARSGDRGALEALLGRFGERLGRHVRRRVGAHLRGRVEVEDVIQETLARAVQSIEGFQWRGEESFLRWLEGISEHVILKAADITRRDQVLLVEEDDVPAGGVSPSRALRRAERLDRLDRALEGLSPEHREVIVLVRLRGLPLGEVARRMDRTPNAVAHLLSRALGKLKEAFGGTESFGLAEGSLDRRSGRDR